MNLESLGAMSISARSYQNPVVGKRWPFRNVQARVKAKLPRSRAQRGAGWLGVTFGLILVSLPLTTHGSVLCSCPNPASYNHPELYESSTYPGVLSAYSGSGSYESIVLPDGVSLVDWWNGVSPATDASYVDVYSDNGATFRVALYDSANGSYFYHNYADYESANSAFLLQPLPQGLAVGSRGTANSAVTEASAIWQTTTNTVLYTGLLIGAVWFSYLWMKRILSNSL